MSARAICERIRRILADVEEAEGAVEGERTRPGGRLVVSAPVGFGRLHVSPVMSAYLMRYPEVSGELRLSDRMINLVEDGVDLAIRIGHLADSSLVARQVGEMRRIVVASAGYLKARGEPKTPDAIASHATIQFGATAASPDWRFVEAGREIRIACTPRLPDQQRRCRDPVCRAGRRPDPGAGLSGRRRRSRPAG